MTEGMRRKLEAETAVHRVASFPVVSCDCEECKKAGKCLFKRDRPPKQPWDLASFGYRPQHP
jgi:hypothetical protein